MGESPKSACLHACERGERGVKIQVGGKNRVKKEIKKQGKETRKGREVLSKKSKGGIGKEVVERCVYKWRGTEVDTDLSLGDRVRS